MYGMLQSKFVFQANNISFQVIRIWSLDKGNKDAAGRGRGRGVTAGGRGAGARSSGYNLFLKACFIYFKLVSTIR